MKLDQSSVWSITNERMTRSRGKNTCEAPEMAAAILLQVHKRSEELRFSKVSGWPYESDASENVRSRSVPRAMSNLVTGVEPPMNKGYPLYSPGCE
jgi:hypothetical protein